MIPKPRRALARSFGRERDGGQRVPLDCNGIGGVFRNRQRFGYYHCNGFANETRPIYRKKLARRSHAFTTVPIRQWHIGAFPRAADRIKNWLEIADVNARKHRKDSGKCLRPADVDRYDSCVRMWRPHEYSVRRRRDIKVIDVTSLTFDELIVFLPEYRITNPSLTYFSRTSYLKSSIHFKTGRSYIRFPASIKRTWSVSCSRNA